MFIIDNRYYIKCFTLDTALRITIFVDWVASVVLSDDKGFN